MIADSGPGILYSIFAFIMVISVLVFVHEMGHYLVARWFGVRAESFSIGFGREVAGWTDKRGTRWKWSLWPFGGYVQFAGDMDPASAHSAEFLALPEEQRNGTFQSKPLWQRAAIVFAGPAINFLLAIVIMAGFIIAYGYPASTPTIYGLTENSAAAKMGLRVGDVITAVNGIQVETFEEMAQEVVIRPNETVTIAYIRDDQSMEISGKIGVRYEEDRFGNRYAFGIMGIQGPEAEYRKAPLYKVPVLAVSQTADVVRLMATGLAQIITGKRPLDQLGGPMKIAQVSGEQMDAGPLSLISFIALMSINLGFMNLLPIPMLDGGHLMLYGLEAVRRRPASPKTQEWLFRFGFAVMASFMVFVIFNDLSSFGLFRG